MISFNLGHILDSRGTLTFVLLELITQDQSQGALRMKKPTMLLNHALLIHTVCFEKTNGKKSLIVAMVTHQIMKFLY